MAMKDESEISTLLATLHNRASHPPRFALTYRSAQKWEEYAEGCREIERELARLGVEL